MSRWPSSVQVLAQGYAQQCKGNVDEQDLEELLKKMPVDLGGNKIKVKQRWSPVP